MIPVTKYLKCPTESGANIDTLTVVLVLLILRGPDIDTPGRCYHYSNATSTYFNCCFFGKILLISFSWLIVQGTKRRESLKDTGIFPLSLISEADDKCLLQKKMV